MATHKLDLATWARKDHYQFFKSFTDPFFGVTVPVDCTAAYHHCKSEGHSFFLYYLHQSLAAANQTEAFRYRIQDNDVYLYDTVNASPTINRPDGTFGFAYMMYREAFAEFAAEAQQKIAEVQATTGLQPAISGENVIHYTTLPWLAFTQLSHPRHLGFADSCPKISFGKMVEEGGRRTMPMAVHVHHALMDGYQVAQYVQRFQEGMNG